MHTHAHTHTHNTHTHTHTRTITGLQAWSFSQAEKIKWKTDNMATLQLQPNNIPHAMTSSTLGKRWVTINYMR